MSFAQRIVDEAPPWLKTGDGARLLFTAGVQMDAIAERVLHGLASRWPMYGTDEVLAAIGRDRRIMRGAFETSETYAARLLRWLDDWALGGSPWGIMKQVQAYLAPFEVRTRIVNDGGSWYTLNPDGSMEWSLSAGNWNWDEPDVGVWSRFWLILYPPPGLWVPGPLLDDPALWGGALDTDSESYSIGTSAPAGHVKSIRKIVSDWKDEKSQCKYIIVSFDDALFDPAGPADTDGLWGNHSKVVAGVRVPARSPDAEYWPGTTVDTYEAL